jgi:transcriptional regulator with XRE-family HTH domain
MTQAQFAQLLGVHPVTVAKWEAAVLEPTPYQASLIEQFRVAGRKRDDAGEVAIGILVAAGVAAALFFLLQLAFKRK